MKVHNNKAFVPNFWGWLKESQDLEKWQQTKLKRHVTCLVKKEKEGMAYDMCNTKCAESFAYWKKGIL